MIALGLAMDSMAAAVSSGVAVKKPGALDTLRLALLFGMFQCAMFLFGRAAGMQVSAYVQATHHYVAFALLAFIGLRMIYEAFRPNESRASSDPFATKNLLVMAFATSIDAFAAGVSLAITGDFIWISALLIGLAAFSLSLLGVKIGGRLGALFRKRAEILGGTILTLIGLKILLEHLL